VRVFWFFVLLIGIFILGLITYAHDRQIADSSTAIELSSR